MIIDKPQDDEFDLVSVIKLIWSRKWKIAITVIVFAIVGLVYEKISPKKKFNSTSIIERVDSIELDKYFFYNDIIKSNKSEQIYRDIDINDMEIKVKGISESNPYPFLEISSQLLEEFFIETIKKRSLFEKGIHKYKLLDASNYADKEKYEDAITKLASSINIIETIIDKELNRSYFSIEFSHYKSEKWLSVLSFVEKSANSAVKKNLQDRFRASLEISKLMKSYEIEDIKKNIENRLLDYELKTADRLLFLREQAEIARAIDIAKNTIEVKAFGSQNTMFSKIQPESPFYLRGYEAIEKEIELIEQRTKADKISFIDGMIELEQKKRNIEQNQRLNRIKYAFQSSPLAEGNDFTAASIMIVATKFKYPTSLTLQIAILLGLIFGVLNVLIFSSPATNNSYKKK
ncbi:Wzz/FepE/Etk N-terminal domain-containing protein [Candidatus Pelagibacter bacterium]|nr:Wzz/FepE/Etk N-terminal domain-containing protein [Candidatus Pelagibacter bacterium]MDA8836204.1 Wzz/FepE/Etk N-terminal domain-containing protein [Candidatus Pelagibacter bacterium]